MTLSHLLTPDLVKMDLEASDRWSAIVEMVGLLVAAGKVKPENSDGIQQELKKREESMSTGIGFGVAIPHTSSEHVDEVVAAFARSERGVEFEALDSAPVHFIILFIVPKDEFQSHLRTLAAIAKFLNDRAVREQLRDAESAEQVLKILSDNSDS